MAAFVMPPYWDCDEATARRLIWVKANRRPDESRYEANQRYLELTAECRAFERRHLRRCRTRTAPVAPILIDDGEEDSMWSLDHRQRRMRIRPWRPEDGEPALHRSPCITVINLDTGQALRGIPQHVLRLVGVPADPWDHDLYGELVFEVLKASKGFNPRNKAPAGVFE